MGVTTGVLGLVVGGAEVATQSQAANQAFGLASGIRGEQQQYNAQLMQLLKDPGSFFKSPVYQSAFDQGTQAVARSNAAQGFLGGGTGAAALQRYGQSFGAQQLLSQEQLLASLSGAQNASSPSQALGAGVGASALGTNTLEQFLYETGLAGRNWGTPSAGTPLSDPSQAAPGGPVAMESWWGPV